MWTTSKKRYTEIFDGFFRPLDASNEDKVKQGVTSQSWMVSFCFIKEKTGDDDLPIRLATLN